MRAALESFVKQIGPEQGRDDIHRDKRDRVHNLGNIDQVLKDKERDRRDLSNRKKHHKKCAHNLRAERLVTE